mmetsp:Transcript_12400/g.33335  ORF Transcript_12400/g.33335 Transcript_12400/m.33335 type:complete len:232 (-) Transcript_12400:249-944(-)
MRTCTRPICASPGNSPPSTRRRSRRSSATQAAGTSSRRTRTKVAMGMLSEKISSGSRGTDFAFDLLLLEPPPWPPTWPSPPSVPPLAPSTPSAPSAATFGFGSPSSSSSALLQPPVTNFRDFRASFRSASQRRSDPGRTGIRAVSRPSMSPRLPKSPASWRPRLADPSAPPSSPPTSSSSSSPSSSKSAKLLWSVGPPARASAAAAAAATLRRLRALPATAATVAAEDGLP